MSGWIINVDGNRPHNWDIAKEHAVWATTKRFPIAAGDDLFFWKTEGGGLIAHAIAAEDARPVSDREGVPWPDHAERHYVSRFDLVRISEPATAATRSWSDLQVVAEFTGMANRGVARLDSEQGIERLRSLVLEGAISQIPAALTKQVEAEREALDSDIDARRFTQRSVVIRRGQPQFRAELIRLYDGRCCISGCDAEPALEAAHIVPYKGDHTNTPANGLLLRADLHTLFDLFELTIDASTHRVRLSNALKNSQYREFDQIRVNPPNRRTAAPAPDALRAHNTEFDRIRGLS
jgi:predicted restriction endonuclease